MISEALRLLRVFHDLKQKELAEKLGISKSHISEIENGNRTPSLDVVGRYSECFSVPVSSIMFFSENLSTQASGIGTRDKGKAFIASKVLKFLQLVEDRTEFRDAV